MNIFNKIYVKDIPENEKSMGCTGNALLNNRFDMNSHEDVYIINDEIVTDTRAFILKYLTNLTTSILYEYRLIIKEDENTYVTYNFPLIYNLYKIKNKHHELLKIYNEGKTKEVHGRNVMKYKVQTLLGEFYIFREFGKPDKLYATEEQMNHMLNFIKNTIKENMKFYKFRWKKLKTKSSRKCSIFNKKPDILKNI